MTLVHNPFPMSYPRVSIYADTHDDYRIHNVNLDYASPLGRDYYFHISENGENYNLNTEQVADILRQHFKTQRLAEQHEAVKSAQAELDMIVRLVDDNVSSEESTG